MTLLKVLIKKIKGKNFFLTCDYFFENWPKKNLGGGGSAKVHVAFRGGYQNVYVCLQGGEGGSKISEKWLHSLCTTPYEKKIQINVWIIGQF